MRRAVCHDRVEWGVRIVRTHGHSERALRGPSVRVIARAHVRG